MKTTKLKRIYKEKIMRDQVLCGKISQALDKSITSVRYRMLPADDERFTYPRIQTLIREHLDLAPETLIIEETQNPKASVKP